MDPFDVFPVKVWEEILHRLENPLDKLNLINTNESLELLELFQENEAEWHFTAVLGILLGHLYRRQQRINDCVNKPWVGKGELKSAILNCRLICKGTKKIVDNFVEGYWKKHFWYPPFASPFRLNCLEHVDECLAQAGQLKRNNRSMSPFISGGSLYLLCGEWWNFDQEGNVISARPSLEKAAQLFSHSNIGINLRGICIAVNFRVDDLEGTCNFVRNLFHSVPNVLNLSIQFFPVGTAANSAEPEVDVLPLPELPHLKILEVYEHNDEDHDVCSCLRDYLDFTQYSEQLTSLEITLFFWKDEYKSTKFPKLKSLLLYNVQIDSRGIRDELMEIVVNLNAPSLEYLTLFTDGFKVSQMRHEHFFFRKFLKEQVLQTILWWRQNEKWTLDRSIEQPYGDTYEQEKIFMCSYVFTRKFKSSTIKNIPDKNNV